jgi:uncharacterized protein
LNRIIYRLVLFAERHAPVVIAFVAAATLAMGWFALHIQADTSVDTLVPRNREVQRLTEKYGAENEGGSHLLLLFLDDELFTARKLALIAEACEKTSGLEHVGPGITPFNFVHFEKHDGRLALGTMSPGAAAPATDEEARALQTRLLEDRHARNLVVSADGAGLCAIFPVDQIDDHRALLAAAESIIAPLRAEMDARISGMIPVRQALAGSLYKDLPTFLSLAVAVILLSYFLGFRTLRSVLLPVLVVGIGTIWTVGTMTLLGYRLSVVLVITPPLVLILGSSYSLHTLNQYYREVQTSGEAKRWIADSVQNVSVTIFLASATTVFGFLSLVTCSLEQVRKLGISAAIGISYCALLALFFLPAVLSLLKTPTAGERDRVVEGKLASAIAGLGRFVVRRRWVVIGLSAAVAVVFGLTIGKVRYDTNFLRYFRYREPSVEASELLIDRFTGFEYLYLTLSAPEGRSGYFQDPAVLAQVGRYEDALSSDPDVKYLASFTSYLRSVNRAMGGSTEVPSTRPMVLMLSRYLAALSSTPYGKSFTGALLNKEATQYTIQLHIWDHERKSLAFEASTAKILPRLQGMAKEMLPAEVTAEYWGETITVLYAANLMTRDQIWSIFISALLVFLISALIFRSLRLGLAVLLPMAVGIMLNFVVMSLTSIPLDAVTITFSSIAIGIGVDNAIHLTIWYRRQSARFPEDPARCIEETLKVAGRPIVLTSLSIMAALLVFIFSRFRPIAYFGILISLSLAMTATAALTLLSAILYMGARRRLARSRAVAPKP